MSGLANAGLTGWMVNGACKSADPDIFFPDERGSASAGHTMRAKAVCARCPVRRECLTYALATRQKYGVWGGATEGERRVMVRLNPWASPRVGQERPAERAGP